MILGFGSKEQGGNYSVKSGYEILQGLVEEPVDRSFHKLNCSIKAPWNVLSLACKVFLNRIQTKENLMRRRVINNSREVM